MPTRSYIYVSVKDFSLLDAVFCGHGKTEFEDSSKLLKFINMTVTDAENCNKPDNVIHLCGVVGEPDEPIYSQGPRKGMHLICH